MRRALVIALLAVAAPAAAQSLPLVPTGPRAPEAVRYPRLQPIPWFYRQIDLQRQNTSLNGRKNATRDEQIYGSWQELEPREPRPLSEW